MLNIRNQEADALARRLAQIEGSSITDAIVTALREALRTRRLRESPLQAAKAVLKQHGVVLTDQIRKPVPDSVWDELHDDPTSPA